MKQKNIKKIITPFNQSFTISAMVNYWEQNGRFNLSLYSEVIKAKLQTTNG